MGGRLEGNGTTSGIQMPLKSLDRVISQAGTRGRILSDITRPASSNSAWRNASVRDDNDPQPQSADYARWGGMALCKTLLTLGRSTPCFFAQASGSLAFEPK